jgi:hypothetical protein
VYHRITSTSSNRWCDLLWIASVSINLVAQNNSLILIAETCQKVNFLLQLPPSQSYYQDGNGPPELAVW